jgi:hypothetical protein
MGSGAGAASKGAAQHDTSNQPNLGIIISDGPSIKVAWMRDVGNG